MVVIIPPHVPVTPPSPQALELGDRIVRLVRLCREEDPTLDDNDVDVAFRIARRELVARGHSAAALLVVLGLVALLVGGLFSYWRFDLAGGPWSMMGVVAGLLIVFLAVFAIKTARR